MKKKIGIYIYIFSYIILLLNLIEISSSLIGRLLPLSFLLFSTIFNRVFIRPTFKNYTFYLLILILIIGLARSNYPNISIASKIYNIILLLLFSYNTNAIILKNKEKKFYRLLSLILLLPFTFYFLINLISWLIGFNIEVGTEVTGAGEAFLLSKFGIYMRRVEFPFSGGINSFAALAGVFFSFTTFLLIKKQNFIFNLFLWTLCFLILLLSDSRGALFFPFIAVLLFFTFQKIHFLYLIRYFPLLTVIGPIIIFITLQVLADFNFFESLSRNDSDLLTGNSRLIIWLIALQEFINFKLIHLVGYGQLGHYGSGASLEWGELFENYSSMDSSLTHPHNSLFAILFDYGYIGLIIYLLIMIKMTSLYSFNNNNEVFVPLIIIFVFYSTIIGMTESFFSSYSTNVHYCFISIIHLSNYFFLGNTDDKDKF
jgi:O-antigen ligase